MQSQEIAMPAYPMHKPQTSSSYNKTGKHFRFNSSRITSSDASLPTLAKIPFAARKKMSILHGQQNI